MFSENSNVSALGSECGSFLNFLFKIFTSKMKTVLLDLALFSQGHKLGPTDEIRAHAPSPYLVSCCWRMCLTAWARVNVLPVPYGPMMRTGGNCIESGVVMARTASFCFAFSRGSNCSSHCLKKIKMQVILNITWHIGILNFNEPLKMLK